MAERTLDEAEYNALQSVHGVVAQILKNPAGRKLLLQARKAVDPNVSIPEIDAAEPINTAVADVKGDIAALRAELATDRQQRADEARVAAFAGKWADQEAGLRAQGWRNDGITAIRKFAEENAISDLSIAADAWEKRNPAPDISTGGAGAWNMFNGGAGGAGDKEDTFVEDMMKAAGNDERRLDKEIAETIAAARQAR